MHLSPSFRFKARATCENFTYRPIMFQTPATVRSSACMMKPWNNSLGVLLLLSLMVIVLGLEWRQYAANQFGGPLWSQESWSKVVLTVSKATPPPSPPIAVQSLSFVVAPSWGPLPKRVNPDFEKDIMSYYPVAFTVGSLLLQNTLGLLKGVELLLFEQFCSSFLSSRIPNTSLLKCRVIQQQRYIMTTTDFYRATTRMKKLRSSNHRSYTIITVPPVFLYW